MATAIRTYAYPGAGTPAAFAFDGRLILCYETAGDVARFTTRGTLLFSETPTAIEAGTATLVEALTPVLIKTL